MYAYDEMYLEDAMNHIGEMIDYAVYDLNYSLKEYWDLFINSHVCEEFERGNVKYNAGMSGIELCLSTIYEKTGKWLLTESTRDINCSKEYWTGWALAYIQHHMNYSFHRLAEFRLGATDVIESYIFHESDIRKFEEFAQKRISFELQNEENRLKRMRKYAKLTQQMLADKSGVSLRMIQLYEQGQNDINKAGVNVVIALSKALTCSIEDLVG